MHHLFPLHAAGHRKARYDVDMTTGNTTRHLISFALPLLAGNLFQQLYNTVDSIVVGNYVGQRALAAVAASTPIVNIIVGFFMGMSAGVLIRRSKRGEMKMPMKVRMSPRTAVCWP